MQMMKRNIHVVIVLGFLVLICSCAQLGRPGGGEDDTSAPLIVPEGSTPNSQTNFTERTIELVFNEWITVSNPTKEIFVSPPLDYPLEVSDRGKKVLVKFNEKEVLAENTTYQINFGKAIKDLTVGNEMEDYTFLFSTGDKLDQMSLEGSVIDFSTQQAMKDVLVLLHDNLSDTSFTTLKPTYLTRTDENGQFKLKNLRADTFLIYGLIDGNVSYTYDLQTEQVAFLDTLLILTDSIPPPSGIRLEIFDEEDEPRLVEARQKKQGLIKILYQPKPESPSVRFINEAETKTYTEFSGDTILVWHTLKDSASIVLTHEAAVDTITIRTAKKSIASTKLSTKPQPLSILSDDTIKIAWNKPISNIDTSKIYLRDTSSRLSYTSGYDNKTLWLQSDLDTKSDYQLKIDSAAVTDWYGETNQDSTQVAIRTKDPEQFGKIILSITKEDTVSYILELRSTEAMIQKWTILESTDIEIGKMEPGTYKVSIIQDKNGDGRWTSGSVREKRSPEAIKEQALESLKSGWDLETTIDITQIFYGSTGG